MPIPAWAGESSSSIAMSMNPRDSRVVSIYDKYLYDPKDLESSDPRRRELARKASQLKLHGRPANNLDANGLRTLGSSSNSPSAQRKSIAFTQATKAADGYTASSVNTAIAPSSRSQQYSQDQTSNRASASAEHDRDSGAFGLGLGMLGGSDSESDSDSDDERSNSRKDPTFDQLKSTKDSDRPESWTDRAVAVGHRPPDNASQNPPSLKLMALKSAKQGADPSGSSSQDEPNTRLAVNSSFVDRTSRHGSTIGFAGASPILGQASSLSAQSDNGSKRLSARTALTKQLGLVTPNPETSAEPPARDAPPNQRPGPHDYFDTRAPYANQARSPPRGANPLPPIDVARAQQHNFGQRDDRGSPMGPSTPNSATPFRSPGHGSTGMPSPSYPHGPGSMPPNVLQRGPPSPYGPPGHHSGPGGPGGPGAPNGPGNFGRPGGPHATQGANGGPPSFQNGPPRPVQGRGPGTGPMASSHPPPSNYQLGPGLQGQNGPQARGPPGPNSNFGPSFSDARGPPKRQSLFRRSMAMFGGSSQAGPPGNGPGPNNPPRSQPPQKRQSFFRRSMAMLTGGSGPNNSQAGPPQQGANQMPVQAPAAPRATPVPRVQGLQEDFEKPDHPRKSQYLGAGGLGAEWDTNGEGAKFWRRFSMAQKTAGTNKMEDGSKAWMASMASGRRKLIVMGSIALIALVGIIVGVIVWREIVSPSGSNSSEPSSSYKANIGGNNGGSAASASVNSASTTSKKGSSTATSTSSSNYYGRSLTADASAQDAASKHLRRAVAHELGSGSRMRKRHFGRAIAAASPEQQASLADLD